MGFDSLLGNERLKENLENSLKKGHISHFYLISGPKGSGKHTLARLLAAAALCESEDKPCLMCRSCRKVMAGVHPDFITVDDPEKKTVPVDLIRSAREDMFILPNEGKRKIYLFPRGQDMGIPGQNALLKVLEEPPEYGVFLLLTDNPEKLLPTIRSRGVALAMGNLPEPVLKKALQEAHPEASSDSLAAAMVRSGGFLGQAMELLAGENTQSPQTQGFLDSFARGDNLGLLQVLSPMERWKREQLIEELEQWQTLLGEALLEKSGMPGIHSHTAVTQCSAEKINRGIARLKKAVQYAQGNVSVGAVCGWLLWELG